jgi:hypothetical protein
MPDRRLPVRPDLKQLQRQAKELLRTIRAGDADSIAELRKYNAELIDHSATKLADPNIRASLRVRLEEGHGGGGPLREYRDVTPLGWGERYDAKIFVSRESLRLITAKRWRSLKLGRTVE